MTRMDTPAPSSPTLPRPRWALLEQRRSLVSTLVGCLLGLVVTTVVLLAADPGRTRTVLAVVVVWAVFSATHTVLTWWAFHGLAGEPLRAALAAEVERKRRQSRWSRAVDRWLLAEASTSSWSVQISAMALLGVLIMVITPSLRAEPLLLVAMLTMVTASWTNVAVTYAVGYARSDLVLQAETGLGFPGDEPRSFTDYLYFALATQTTFATTDVEIRTTPMRRLVMGHGVLAFAFNTVIIAILVSLLVGVRS